jgi:hypothetical protein
MSHAELILLARPVLGGPLEERSKAARSGARDRRRITMTMPVLSDTA